MSRRTSSTPVRVGLTPTPFSRRSLPSMMEAATSQNAAELISPGTSMDSGAESFFTARQETRFPSCRISAPKARSILSVWSREGNGSMTVVSPSARSPASRIADFTCALAIGILYSIPCSFFSAGRIVIGRYFPPARPAIRAPIRESGSITRLIGRR